MVTDSSLNTLQNYYAYIKLNPIVTSLTILIILLILYFIMSGSLGSTDHDPDFQPTSDYGSNSGIINFLVIIVVIALIIAGIIFGSKYFFNVDIIANMKNYFSKLSLPATTSATSASDSSSNTIQIPTVLGLDVEQLYHIPGNHYTYNDAKALCSAYGSTIANYEQIESAYNKGADWCSYGWSDNQMAFFPTQHATWDKLQKSKGHENDCGHPGINGGYIDSPDVRFGVNCYGHKPKITPQQATLLSNTTLYPNTPMEQEFNKRVDYWKKKIDSILVAPFNSKVWSL